MSAVNGGYMDNEKAVMGGEAVSMEMDETCDAVRAEQQKRRDQAPLWNCRLVTSYPKVCFALTLGLHLGSIFAMFILVVPGYEVLPDEVDKSYMDIRDNTDFLRGLAWLHRNQDNDIIQRVKKQEERTEIGEGMEYYFECKDCNVFTPENLQSMMEAEDKLVNDKTFRLKYCYRVVNTQTLDVQNLAWNYTCFPPYSVLRLFDGSMAFLLNSSVPANLFTPDFPCLFDPTFANIQTVMTTANNFSFTRDMLDYFLSKHSFLSETEVESSIVRGTVAMGIPLAGYDTVSDRREKQEEKLKDYVQDQYYDTPNKIYEDGAGKLKFYFNSVSAYYKFFNIAIYRDTMFIIGSFCFIFLFIWLQTCSLFITVFAAGSIITSFCIANLIYRFILDIRYFGNLHFLAVFIVLGIGVDDVFIFNDTWKQTGYYQYKSLAHRLSDCFRRTATTMLFTSLTTIVAFSVNISSPFLTIRTLSIFSALSVFVIYCSVVVYFPCVVIIYHLYIEKHCPCPWEKSKDKYDPNGERQNNNVMVRFFGGPYHRFVTSSVVSPSIIALFTAATAVFIYFITTIKIDIDMVTVNPFRVNNNFGKFFNRRYSDFTALSPPLRIFLVWGLKKQDLDVCQWSEIDCFGDTVYDEDFDLNSLENQRQLQKVCRKLKSLSSKELGDLHIQVNKETGEPEVDCFLDDLEDFLVREETPRVVCDPTNVTSLWFQRRYNDNQTFSLPVGQEEALGMMSNTPFIYYNQGNIGADYEGWFEIAVSHWMYGGWQTRNVSQGFCVPAIRMEIPMMMGMPEQFRKYDALLGEQETSDTISFENPAWIDFTYKYATKLKYVAIVINTTLDANGLRYPEGLPIRDRWEEWMDEQLKDMPHGLKNGFQTTPEDNYSFNLWHNLAAQKALVDTAWIGIGVGLGMAFVILIIGTMNLLVALLSTISLACITVLVVGLLPMAGWKIELFETIILTLVVGFEADYTIHMAIGYGRSAHAYRRDRTRDALAEVGISIFSGFMTTMGSCFFMFFAMTKFFPEFAAIVFATLGFSFLFSVVLLPALLSVIGPENEYASLWPLWRKVKECCLCRG